MLQAISSVLLPGHGRPPGRGLGLLQSRDRDLRPPHLLLHADQLDHEVQPPSTTKAFLVGALKALMP